MSQPQQVEIVIEVPDALVYIDDHTASYQGTEFNKRPGYIKLGDRLVWSTGGYVLSESLQTESEQLLIECLEGLQEFVNRVQEGTVRSTYTYHKFLGLIQKARDAGYIVQGIVEVGDEA